MLHLKSISKVTIPNNLKEVFPFNTPVISRLTRLNLEKPVTFFVGENGSGKSTLLEGIAASTRLPIIGSQNLNQDDTLKFASELAEHLNLSWTVKTNKGFFLRAEDFFGFTKKLNRLRWEIEQDIQHFDQKLPDGIGKNQAIGALQGQILELTQRYGVDLNAQSHGESFLALFKSRIKPNSLYLLDEPETPLSPTRQMSLLILIDQMVQQNCQFIIATHSPILMAYPNAQILNFNDNPISYVKYDDVDHVNLLKNFINHKDKYLKELGL